jgi:hypothetical protein
MITAPIAATTTTKYVIPEMNTTLSFTLYPQKTTIVRRSDQLPAWKSRRMAIACGITFAKIVTLTPLSHHFKNKFKK